MSMVRISEQNGINLINMSVTVTYRNIIQLTLVNIKQKCNHKAKLAVILSRITEEKEDDMLLLVGFSDPDDSPA